MSTLFACPSPKRTNHQGLWLNSAGELFDRSGRRWGRSQIAGMAMDAMPPELATGERDHEAREMELRAELQRVLDEFDLHDEPAAAIMALVDKHFPAPNKRAPGPDATRGKGARDGPLSRHRAPGGHDDDDDEIERRVKEYLEGHGLDPASVKKALEIMRRDRAAAAVSDDELPNNRFGNGPPIKQRLETDAELEKKISRIFEHDRRHLWRAAERAGFAC